jgi:hypothetical protein
MMANYLLRKNEIEKAIQQYKDIIERNPSKLKRKKTNEIVFLFCF